ncbi:superoxide dismutase [Myxozyma melibiosi]|uniref:Superoxide dismutase 1 copper chaperone n=1 Tax=Myxozyma melibiosi TaxID=54550 RepID=A0ABR1EY90_9ASCO
MTLDLKTVFAVPMHCNDCTKDIDGALKTVDGINSTKYDLEKQLVFIEGSAPPSQIVKAIQNTGRDAIVRGSGEPNSSAVCILETYEPEKASSPVRGLARLVKASATSTLVDLTLTGMSPTSTYYASIRSAGDISQGPLSTGGVYRNLGSVTTDATGAGQAFLVKENLPIWEMIGRALVVGQDAECKSMFLKDVAGVIARSAGVWENDKTVCSCSGKTVWEERKDAVSKGITV